MAQLKKYMMVHSSSGKDCAVIQENWRKLAKVETCLWVRTYFNEEKGVRYCLWMAPGEEELKNVFTEIGVSWDSVVAVEETVPDLWGEKWDEHVKKDAVADTLGN